MSTLDGLKRAQGMLAAAAPALGAEDPLSREAVAGLAAGLRAFGPFEHAGWIIGDARTGSLRAWVLPTVPDGQPAVAWGHVATTAESLEMPSGSRLVAGERVHAEPVARVLAEGCDRVFVVPLATDPARPGWLVLGWNAAQGELDDATAAGLEVLGHAFGPLIARHLRRPSSTPPAVRVVPLLSSENSKQIAIAGKWASLGTLSGGVVHEINNPATFIALAAGQIEKGIAAALAGGELAKLSQLSELTSGIQEATRQIRGLVSDFRQFVGGAGKSAMLTVDLERVLLAACAMTKAAHRHDAVLETRIEGVQPGPGRLLVLGPAAVNVLVNSIESLEDGPRPRRVVLQALQREDQVEITITDTGAGIAPEHLPLVFEPFFTTKSSEVHAGIGLTVARSAVESLGGAIRIESDPGVGTTVVMTVPTM